MTLRTRSMLVAGAALVFWAQIVGHDQGQPTFRSDVHTVAVYATVQDPDGRLVPDLTQQDFEILEDGRPRRATVFSHEIVPITVALLLDMSDSMRAEYFRVRESAARFVEVLLPDDRVRIGTFGYEAALSPYLTGDKTILNRILREELWISHWTVLWSALKGAMDSLENEPGRRVVLALTDGLDYCQLGVADTWNLFPQRQGIAESPQQFSRALSDFWGTFPKTACIDVDAVKKQAQMKEFLIYAVGMQPEGLNETIRNLADESGGGRFELKQNADLVATFERVVDELHSQYVLGFVPGALDGKTHKLEIKLGRRGLTARARKSYVAVAR